LRQHSRDTTSGQPRSIQNFHSHAHNLGDTALTDNLENQPIENQPGI
jgi:hypothetical protein